MPAEKEGENQFKVVLELTEMIRTVIHYNCTEGIVDQYMIPYLGCFFLDFSDKTLKGSRVYAIGEQKEQLYQFTFPNIYTGENICWGSVKLPQIEKLKDVEIISDGKGLFLAEYLKTVGAREDLISSFLNV